VRSRIHVSGLWLLRICIGGGKDDVGGGSLSCVVSLVQLNYY